LVRIGFAKEKTDSVARYRPERPVDDWPVAGIDG
jgi:hypothetical protein